MTDITRNEMEARFAARDSRLEAAEAGEQASFTELSGKLDLLNATFGSLRTEVRDELRDVRRGLREVKQDNKNTRWTIAITVVTAGLAGAGAIWTAESNLLTAFQAGLARQSLSSSTAAQTVERAPQPATAPVATAPPPAGRGR